MPHAKYEGKNQRQSGLWSGGRHGETPQPSQVGVDEECNSTVDDGWMRSGWTEVGDPGRRRPNEGLYRRSGVATRGDSRAAKDQNGASRGYAHHRQY
jgi:hypothetical protein